MGIRKLFDGSTFPQQGLNELFTQVANLLQKPNISLYTKMPSVVAVALYLQYH